MRVMDNPQLPHRAIKIVEEHRLCVVEDCMVRSRVLDEWGMCPSELWDWRHEEYADRIAKAVR